MPSSHAFDPLTWTFASLMRPRAVGGTNRLGRLALKTAILPQTVRRVSPRLGVHAGTARGLLTKCLVHRAPSGDLDLPLPSAELSLQANLAVDVVDVTRIGLPVSRVSRALAQEHSDVGPRTVDWPDGDVIDISRPDIRVESGCHPSRPNMRSARCGIEFTHP